MQIVKTDKDSEDESEGEEDSDDDFSDENSIDETQGKSQNKKTKEKTKRDFKPKDRVALEIDVSNTFKAEVVELEASSERLILQLGKNGALGLDKTLKKGKKYKVSYDYQVEEIVWSKKKSALEAFKKSNVQIQNLLQKISDPTSLEPNELIEIGSFFNEHLDENQQEAVQKAMSLDNDSEILLIQGPPGTGKTTTIVEMIKQILSRHRYCRILVSSQSNQAVDNVLEKIVIEEDKILRIGNDENKMSEEARKFTRVKVLDKIIKENLARIRENPIKDEVETIQDELLALQKDFEKRLQSLTAKLARKSVKSRESELTDLFFKPIRLFFGTLIGISSCQGFRDMAFDIVIVDEAGRATLSELLVPCIKAKKIVFVGDHKQLAPVIDDEIAENLNPDMSKKEVRTSFFERLYEQMEDAQKRMETKGKDYKNFYHRLIYNYRAHKSICELYNQPFYEGELRTQEEISLQKSHNLSLFKSNVVWLDTGKRSDREDTQRGTGKINKCNAGVIEDTLHVMLKKIDSETLGDIGIITPYKAQMEALRSSLKDVIKKYKEAGVGIDIGTVDSFQGSDRDVIIYDCVRSSKTKNGKDKSDKKKGGNKVDFIADEKRLNVSLSRAKKLLIIVGDMEFLRTSSVSEGENPFRQIIDYMDANKENYHIQTLNKRSK